MQGEHTARMKTALAIMLGTLLCITTKPARCEEAPTVEGFAWNVVGTLPHDVTHFTQGFEVFGDRIFESSGGYGRSALYELSRESGSVLRKHDIVHNLFAEGLTVFDDHIFVLSWLQRVAIRFNLSLEPQGLIRYSGEGWGLTHDGARLIMSNGSSQLQFKDPATFQTIGNIEVRDRSGPVHRLNELEYVDGLIYANVWKDDRIAVIDPSNGSVVRWIDMSALQHRFSKPPGWDPDEHVLNGIAYDPIRNVFLVTGKCWPYIFLVKQSGDPRTVRRAR